ncbi:MAG: DUF488 family protein [Hyphomicrobiales bacterium]|nr:DUF488 family protein [Hyphomicrobiales bacterium]
MTIRVKRIYEEPAPEDGYRLLVDRLWPRGLSKQNARIDAWMKEIGPSSDLRRWFGHDAERWPEFKARYWAELDARPDLVAEVVSLARAGTVTLLFSARDTGRNQAVALADYLAGRWNSL